MPNWNTLLQVSVNGQMITPISSFVPTFDTPYTVLHSLEATNLGYIRGTPSFTFTMTVPAIGSAVAMLTDLALKGTQFDVTVAEKEGNDWSFNRILLASCIITQVQPSNISLDSGAPAATFNCTALTSKIEKGA
jgi:hypothetical protein